ncbi:hypothetical protein SAMN05660477_01669 [Soonwooa buanensis]|uniref:Uncharacterized protein n=1 Tax=Soonwooa buanensis TaxID=619805 RepID=A0A1T5EWP1_9FLAO|nr:hypothetical protein [Soonwooa buanensis]SKB88278.1 hypothetical protein SAMN05660477_01669 [Soonwooa buanensis]
MINPLIYFESLLEIDKSEIKKQQWLRDQKEGLLPYLKNVDDINGIVTVELGFYDEDSKTWSIDIETYSFYNVFQNEIKYECEKIIENLNLLILESRFQNNSPLFFLIELKNRLKMLLDYSCKLYSDYPFVNETLVIIDDFINLKIKDCKLFSSEFKLRSTNFENSIKKNELSKFNNADSFNWHVVHFDSKKNHLKNLFEMLTTHSKVIDANFEDFYNAFSGEIVTNGINWLLVGKSRKTSIISLCYFIDKLEENGFINEIPSIDFGKKILYVFRENDGNVFNSDSLKSSLSDFRRTKTCAQSDLLDSIISKI